MDSVWTHAICAECWNRRHPDKPARLVFGAELCCFCGLVQAAGIYERENPMRLVCRGRHQAAGDRTGCRHEPADPAAFDSICWRCGAMIRHDRETDRWKTYEHVARRAAGREARSF